MGIFFFFFQFFLPFWRTHCQSSSSNLELLSANSFNLEESKNLSFGKGLNTNKISCATWKWGLRLRPAASLSRLTWVYKADTKHICCLDNIQLYEPGSITKGFHECAKYFDPGQPVQLGQLTWADFWLQVNFLDLPLDSISCKAKWTCMYQL